MAAKSSFPSPLKSPEANFQFAPTPPNAKVVVGPLRTPFTFFTQFHWAAVTPAPLYTEMKVIDPVPVHVAGQVLPAGHAAAVVERGSGGHRCAPRSRSSSTTHVASAPPVATNPKSSAGRPVAVRRAL